MIVEADSEKEALEMWCEHSAESDIVRDDTDSDEVEATKIVERTTELSKPTDKLKTVLKEKVQRLLRNKLKNHRSY